MKQVEPIQTFGQIKLLADSRRMDILRLLMDSPATLTQLARTLKQSPAWIRHHILTLESARLIEVSEVRRTGKVTEKFYRAKSGALLLQEIVLPKSKKPAVVFSGSHDLALEEIAEHLNRHVTLLSLPVGSLDGLVNLRQGLCQVSGAHILDESGEYNTPTVRHIFPDRDVELVTLAHRTQGLILAAGNPKSIKKVSDIARANVKFINRNAGSGTRLWFDAELKKQSIDSSHIHGYDNTVKTHSEAAALILQGKADVSIGLQAAAHQHELDFIPLFEERYDLILPREQEKNLNPLLDYIQTTDFRSSLIPLSGYNTQHSGEQVVL
ncbi:MAG: substrate-binding domain-containing protein [Anaerolineales bacterium]